MSSLARDHYFETALRVLGEEGPDGLTIASLCSALGVTKGSFYHHFTGMPGFTLQLLAHWEDVHTRQLVVASDTVTDPLERIDLLTQISLLLPHAAESALRAWGRSNDTVAATLRRVDVLREATVVDAVRDLGAPEEIARLHARAALAILIGVQQLEDAVDTRQLRAIYDHLNAHLLAVIASERAVESIPAGTSV